jgi:hypothetical protein
VLDFLRLANALSALYPQVCEDWRLLDALLLGVAAEIHRRTLRDGALLRFFETTLEPNPLAAF